MTSMIATFSLRSLLALASAATIAFLCTPSRASAPAIQYVEMHPAGNTSLCLAPDYGVWSKPGDLLRVVPCTGSGDQLWANLSGQIVWAQQDLCIDAGAGAIANGTRPALAACSSSPSQQWDGLVWGAGQPTKIWVVDGGFCLAVAPLFPWSLVGGTPVAVHACGGDPTQMWTGL